MPKPKTFRFFNSRKVDTLVSGGAAFMDHIGVEIFKSGYVRNLILHLPCEWDKENVKYLDTGVFDWKSNPGGTSNFYHRKFSKKVSINSLMDIHYVINNNVLPAKVIVTPGLMERNTKVAEDSDILLALTFGKKGQIKDGGTADTCRKYLKMGKTELFHIDLNTMILHKGEVS